MAERLADLYQKYGGVIYARCRRMLANDAAAEDAVQEVFLRVASHLDAAPTSVEALLWIHRIATNYCLPTAREDVVACVDRAGRLCHHRASQREDACGKGGGTSW
jgi:DNA-directed RNA polymerase specialized sigma24 family protein